MFELPPILSFPIWIIDNFGWEAFFYVVLFALYVAGIYQGIQILSYSERFLGKLVRGEFGLAITFWVFGCVVNFASSFPFEYFLSMVTSQEQHVLGLVLMFALGVAIMAYWPIWSVGVWRAANQYAGPSIWPILTKIVAVLALPVLAYGFWYLIRITSLLPSLLFG